jgi:hypothetical protein
MMKINVIYFCFCLFLSPLSYGQSVKNQGLHTDSMTYDGLTRKYMYYIPSGIENFTSVPVVFFLHGMGASAQIGVNVLGPQYHAKNQESRTKSQEPRTKSQEPRVKNQESRTKSQESRAKNQESRIKSQEPRVKNQESRIKSQEPRVKN